MTNELVHKDVDPDEVDDVVGRRRTRRTRLVAAAGATALLAGGAVVVAQPWGNDDGAGGTAASSTAPRAEVNVGQTGELPFLVLDELPEGWAVQWASDPGDSFGGGLPDTVPLTVAVWKAPDARYSTGPWVGVSVQLLDRFARQSFNPVDFLGSGPDGSRELRVGSYAAAITDNWWGDGSTLLYGPVNDGFAVSIESVGLTEAEILRIADELQLVEDGERADAVLGPAVDELGLQPFLSYVTEAFGFGMGIGGAGLPMSSATASLNAGWGDLEGNSVSVMVAATPAGVDALEFARFLLDDPDDITIGSTPAVVGEPDENFGMGSTVIWVLDGAAVLLSSTLPRDEVIEIAESARVADAGEWADLVAEAAEFQGESSGMPDETWLIGAGDTEDARTWLVEGALDDDGLFTLCHGMFSVFESSTTCGGDSEEVKLPSIRAADNISGGPGDQVFVAFAPVDAEGAVLRITTSDGDVTEVALAQVRADWPFLTAAGLLPWDGVVELVAADGTVLATSEVTADDLGARIDDPGNGTEGGAATETTAAG